MVELPFARQDVDGLDALTAAAVLKPGYLRNIWELAIHWWVRRRNAAYVQWNIRLTLSLSVAIDLVSKRNESPGRVSRSGVNAQLRRENAGAAQAMVTGAKSMSHSRGRRGHSSYIMSR
jgi:hypothetical protein